MRWRSDKAPGGPKTEAFAWKIIGPARGESIETRGWGRQGTPNGRKASNKLEERRRKLPDGKSQKRRWGDSREIFRGERKDPREKRCGGANGEEEDKFGKNIEIFPDNTPKKHATKRRSKSTKKGGCGMNISGEVAPRKHKSNAIADTTIPAAES